MTDAEYLRELATLSFTQRAPLEQPHVTLARAADLVESRADSEPTSPQGLRLRICCHCGHGCGMPTPDEWTPPPEG